jgi:hypothetical protein
VSPGHHISDGALRHLPGQSERSVHARTRRSVAGGLRQPARCTPGTCLRWTTSRQQHLKQLGLERRIRSRSERYSWRCSGRTAAGLCAPDLMGAAARWLRPVAADSRSPMSASSLLRGRRSLALRYRVSLFSILPYPGKNHGRCSCRRSPPRSGSVERPARRSTHFRRRQAGWIPRRVCRAIFAHASERSKPRRHWSRRRFRTSSELVCHRPRGGEPEPCDAYGSCPHPSASRSSPSTCTSRDRTGRSAGPRRTAPEVTSNWLPWQGQVSVVPSRSPFAREHP